MTWSWNAVNYGNSDLHKFCGVGAMEDPPIGPDKPFLRATFVKFTDGGCTRWHYHTGEQMLLAVEGSGFLQLEDQQPRPLNEGDRTFIPAGMWHRHGAIKGSKLIHLAVTYGDTEWDEDDPCEGPNWTLSASPFGKIKSLNQRILNAEEAAQSADLARLLTNDFTITRSTGEKLDRTAYLASVSTNGHRGRSASEIRVQKCGEVAVCTSVVTTTQQPDGTLDPGRFWNTQLFVRQEGKWYCAEWQILGMPA